MIEVDNKEDLDNILAKTEKVLVLFYASWCPFCTRFVPAFNAKIKDFKQFSKVIHVLLNDYDSPLWDDYDIEAVPTIIFFESRKVSSRLDGRSGIGLNEKQLNVWLENF